ncbi:potassium transporter Kup [Paracoccus sp. p3-h83]|uniref:potassium transporter Kup n=1 Tax=Paracoccus sp. p3-h83 TaxID=3342805 RepID=UPI0035B7742C
MADRAETSTGGTPAPAATDPVDFHDHPHGPPPLNTALVMGTLGVVYGDIGTSPLYALRESLAHATDGGLFAAEVIGIVSLLIWTIMLIVTLKYVVLILRADNNGEGGTLSLVAKAQQALGGRTPLVFMLGIIGCALFFGDAMITPAISILSAVEGLTLIEPDFAPYVLPVTLAIVIGLFAVQRKGTASVSRFFGPITLLWFTVMAVLGASHIRDSLSILHALNPLHALSFIADHRLAALPVLGSVFLAVTGAEALYADMGHFGRGAIRIAWGAVVAPALVLAYLGQGALVLAHPEAARDPFFLMAPQWGLAPLVLLATVATVIASQAVISGAFSIAQQAVQLGLLPRLEIQHTSDTHRGQIYLPKVNLFLMIGVFVLIVSFGSSARLASAYGIAVTGDMVITSGLAIVVFRYAWKWSWGLVLGIMLPILAIEAVFLSANMAKVFDGGIVPLMFAALVATMMLVWVRGTRIVQAKLSGESVALSFLADKLTTSEPTIVPGTAVFLTADPTVAPPALMHNLKHNRVLHEANVIVKVDVANTPRVDDDKRLKVERIAPRFWVLRARFGYMEQPNVPRVLAHLRRDGIKTDVMHTSYFLNRRAFRTGKANLFPLWQQRLYVSLFKSASDATSFYRLPSNRVVEMGQQINI